MLTQLVRNLSVCMSELHGETVNSMKTVADVSVKLKAAGKRANDVAYKRDGLEAVFHRSRHIQDKVGVRITQV